MALFRSLHEGKELLGMLANGAKIVSRRVVVGEGRARGAGGAMVQRARRHSLPNTLSRSQDYTQLESGRMLMLCEHQQLNCARCISSAQHAPAVTEIRSSIQDHIDPCGVVKTKKFVMAMDELMVLIESGPDMIKLVDVREPKEVEETSLLPRAVNIPLSQLKAALLLEPEMFEIQYGLKKPTKTDLVPLVFYGRSAVKSSTALEIAYKLGFKKSRHYPGGWEEWSTRNHPGV